MTKPCVITSAGAFLKQLEDFDFYGHKDMHRFIRVETAADATRYERDYAERMVAHMNSAGGYFLQAIGPAAVVEL